MGFTYDKCFKCDENHVIHNPNNNIWEKFCSNCRDKLKKILNEHEMENKIKTKVIIINKK